MNTIDRRRPVLVSIVAGLGNQLFQYATARAVSLRVGAPLRFDLHWYEQRPNRPYRLNAYAVQGCRASDDDLAQYYSPLFKKRFVRGAAVRSNRLLPFAYRRIITEESLAHDHRISRLNRPICLRGFWQSERYFIDHAATIRRELSLPTQIPECYRAAWEIIQSSEALGLVVRRGDYVGLPETQGICTERYYRNALALIGESVPHPRVFVFSDDIAWCRENLTWIDDACFVANETPDCPEEHLRLLAACKHFIVANSTFAWWGAWLSRRPGLIVAPQSWMQSGEQWSDIIPSTWLRVGS